MASVLSNGGSDRGSIGVQERDDEADSDELLTLLGDEHTRQVLTAVAEEPRAGGEIAAALPLSRATVYRRLNELEAAGLVTSSTVLCPDGHHHNEYRATLDSIQVQIADDLTVSVAAGDSETVR